MGVRETVSPPAATSRIRTRVLSQRADTDLRSGNAQKANGHQHSGNCDLIISELNPVQILNAETVGRNQTI
jgi:hypothetical protein